ncbi:LON peptidase N-terminal domain and RING finger protein 3 [Hyla sarda]|uniref:LON peptidase N-terminal domain and RING finger protein 3 n=1 Tax=Hyla sarda TaxID=327740 RepID=UPI0024C32A10|nr:LON peptidase N-terminal domain and RING finger protein 3 [Hyla sarda]
MGTQQGDSASLMLEFAAQAFQAKNFQLACEIYERQLQEQQSGVVDWGLLLRRADCLAYTGKLQDAFHLYQEAAAQKKLRVEQLETLVSCLADQLRERESLPLCPQWGILTCKECQGFLYEPVTLPCGHTYCKKCLENQRSRSQCKMCSRVAQEGTEHPHRVNVLLSNIIAKWFSCEVQAAKLRHEGNALLGASKFQDALEKYNEAISLVSLDHLLYSNRSVIHLNLKSYELALNDAEIACKLQPYWLKGHLRKAQALVNLGKTEDALKEFLYCLVLDSGNKTATSEAQKLLLNILSPGHSQEDLPDILQIMPHPSRVKGSPLNSVGSSDYGCNTQRLYRINMEYKKSLKAPEEVNPAGCKAPWKFMQTKENKTDVEGQKTSSEEKSLILPLRCKTIKRKLSSDDASDGRMMERPCKFPKRDVSANSGDQDVSVSSCVDPSDLDCSLCIRLLYEPVTTPCGHTYCLKCLERCLDHNPKCPLCKEDLCEYLAMRNFCKTDLTEELIAKYFPEELKERKMVYEEEIAELSNLNTNVPIFVCTMAYPTVPCPLHIFEPCYRLMIRRCMETGTKQFGMCIGDSVKGFADYGCILEIRNVEFFADGRSVVDSIGKRRFKVIRHSQRDGYNTADIEYIEDEKVQEEHYAELLGLHDSVYDQAYTWFTKLKPALKNRILSHFGPMPAKETELQVNPNGPAWCWWILAVLPLESRAQLPFLAMTSLKDRLTSIRRVLLFMCRTRTQ